MNIKNLHLPSQDFAFRNIKFCLILQVPYSVAIILYSFNPQLLIYIGPFVVALYASLTSGVQNKTKPLSLWFNQYGFMTSIVTSVAFVLHPASIYAFSLNGLAVVLLLQLAFYGGGVVTAQVMSKINNRNRQ